MRKDNGNKMPANKKGFNSLPETVQKKISPSLAAEYRRGGRATLKKGGSAYHTTKDGRRVKKGLYYYMNKAKKSGKSRPGKGTVTDKALKRSAKTAKKA